MPQKTTIIDSKDFQSVYTKVESIGERLSRNRLPRDQILAYLTGLLKPVSLGTTIKPEDINIVYSEVKKIKKRLCMDGIPVDDAETYLNGVLTLTKTKVKEQYW